MLILVNFKKFNMKIEKYLINKFLYKKKTRNNIYKKI